MSTAIFSRLTASVLGVAMLVLPATSQAGGSSMTWKASATNMTVEAATMTDGFIEFEMENYFPDQRSIILDSIAVTCSINGLVSPTLITQSAQISAPWMTTIEKKLIGSKKTKNATFSVKKVLAAGDSIGLTIDMGINKQAKLGDMSECHVRSVKVRDVKTGKVLYNGIKSYSYMYVDDEMDTKGQLIVGESDER